jgi:pentatricopeptide repeat protein
MCKESKLKISSSKKHKHGRCGGRHACKRGRVTKAMMEVFDAMHDLGCEPTIHTYTSLVGRLYYAASSS